VLVHVPFVSADSATLVAFTVLPLSALVPWMNAHIFTLIDDGFTVTVCRSDVFEETVTVVVRELPPNDPLTVRVEPFTFVTDPTAKPPLPGNPPPVRGVPPAGGVGLLPPVPLRSPFVHEPFTGCEMVIRVAATTPLLLRVPVAITQAPAFRLDCRAAFCSVTFAEPAETADLPDGLSDVVIVKIVPFTAITGPNNDPWTGAAALAAAGTRANAANAAMTRRTIIHLRWS
jgi:hypothetical protein